MTPRAVSPRRRRRRDLVCVASDAARADDDRRDGSRHLLRRIRRHADELARSACARNTEGAHRADARALPRRLSRLGGRDLAVTLPGETPRPDLPLDIRATAFQMRVWKYLQTIPSGDVAVVRRSREPRSARGRRRAPSRKRARGIRPRCSSRATASYAAPASSAAIAGASRASAD